MSGTLFAVPAGGRLGRTGRSPATAVAGARAPQQGVGVEFSATMPGPAPVAQPDRVVASEAIGRGFESLQARQFLR